MDDLLNSSIVPDPSKRLFYEKLDISGLDQMHSYSLDERLYEFFEFQAFKDKTETKNYINKLEKRMLDQSAIYWFIKLKENKKIIGTVCLTNINKFRKSAEQGYALDPNYWGKGLVIEIESSLTNLFFEKLNFHRLYGITMIKNERTISSCLASGFKFESIVKDYYFNGNEFVDGWSYYLLSHDYKNNMKISNNVSSKKKFHITDLVEELKILFDDQEINEHTSIENYYKWDSVSHIDVILTIQKKFNHNFSNKEITEIYSLKDILNILNN